MTRSRFRIRAHLWAILKQTLLGALVAQTITVAILVTWDATRKRRNKKQIDLRLLASDPHNVVETVEIGETEAKAFTYGEDLYEDMLAAIAGAEESVLIESYIWKGDATGRRFKQAVVDAADRGVDVRVIFDTFANLVVSRRFKTFPRHVKVLAFPLFNGRLPMINLRNTGRDHRKILVVDGRVGYVGGYNIGSVYATQWRDTHLRLVGPGVWGLENAFIDFWNAHVADADHKMQDHGTSDWDSRIRVHRNSPRQLVYPIRGMYLEAIDRAKDHIYITQAYFLPDDDILKALFEAAGRGVSVKLLVPRLSNHVVADWIARGLYEKLLDRGIDIYLYEDAMVHAKTATIDGRWSTVGTANIDRLSLSGNYEINVEVFDEGLATQLERVFETDLRNTTTLTMDTWTARPEVVKFSEAILAPLRRLL